MVPIRGAESDHGEGEDQRKGAKMNAVAQAEKAARPVQARPLGIGPSTA